MTTVFIKLDSPETEQREFGTEVILVRKFIEYWYFKREYSKDSHDRYVIMVKYGNDLFRLQKKGDEFVKWYNSLFED